MKKVINGRLYNTETATERGVWSNTWDVRIPSFCQETLYQKRNGEFFIFGEGGAGSKYAESIGQNDWRGGEMILPLTVESAKAWSEEHLDADQYAEIFGLPEESDERVALNIQIPASLAAQLKLRAAEAQMSITAYVVSVLEQ